MSTLTPAELEAIDRNHARLAAIGDGGRTLDMFAQAGGEDFTLAGETIRQASARTAPTPPPQMGFEF